MWLELLGFFFSFFRPFLAQPFWRMQSYAFLSEDEGGRDILEPVQMLTYLHAHGKPMRRVGHQVLWIGKRCMKHYYNVKDAQTDVVHNEAVRRVLAYLHKHGKPMQRVGHQVLQIGKRCMKHYYNVEDGEGDKAFKTHPEICHTTMKDTRVPTQSCDQGDGANAKAAPALNDQKVHMIADINTRTIAFHVQSLFLSPPPRGTFKIYGNVGMIRRDALWFARYKPDGSYPLYRTGKTAYGGPRKAQRCKGGVLDAVAPNPMPAWMEATLDDLSKRHDLPELPANVRPMPTHTLAAADVL
tara:strand:+ start:535 stop:1428 length:894 start_codon:yes stop_codon:yes gene_type:complete